MSKKTKDNVKDPLIFETAYRRDTAAHLDEEIEKRYPGKYHEQELLTEYPTVYIIDNQGKQSNYKEDYTVYVGETIDIQRRTLEHLDTDPETRQDWEELRNAKNAHMFVIGHEHFNKSLALDIENRMMQYLSSVDVISKLNNRRENAQRKYYTSDEFIPILTVSGISWVKTRSTITCFHHGVFWKNLPSLRPHHSIS